MKLKKTGQNNQDAIFLKGFSNDSLIMLSDMPISIKEMNPIVLKPNWKSELQVKFMMPYNIRSTIEVNRKTINLIFSLYDQKDNSFYGANLPCTIPL